MGPRTNRPTQGETFHSHHAPLGAFASFTLGLVDGTGGFGHALRGPARQNVYVGYKTSTRARWSLLPFFTPGQSGEGDFTGEESVVRSPAGTRTLSSREYRRALGWASDTWRAHGDRFGFCLLSPFGQVPDPARMTRDESRLHLSPHLNGWIEFDNRGGKGDVQLMFGIGEPDDLFHPLADDHVALPGFALGTRFAYATQRGQAVESRQGFDVFNPKYTDHRGLHVIGGESALVFTVPAGAKRRFPLVLAFYIDGTVTTGMPTRYAYTRHFTGLGDVLAHGLGNRRHYERLAGMRDRELAGSKLSDDQKFLLAQATHSYLGNTQLLWGADGPVWVVYEGEYRMMNTFDLTVDHLFFELRYFPWAVRNALDRFVDRYQYRDRLRWGGRLVKGGISFTHDMGVAGAFTPPGRSSYECTQLRGCFSHMSMEELLNWILCAVTYGLWESDRPFLSKRAKVLSECAESLRRRDDPVPSKRTGVLKLDSHRCGPKGAEITTYDALDPSLGQARNNLYMAVKTLGAWVLLEAAFTFLGKTKDAQAAADSADRVAGTVLAQFDASAGAFPALFDAANPARILPAIEGLAYPLFLRLHATVDRKGRFAPLLARLATHLKTCLRKGVCLDAVSGGWKMCSASTNTWFSKIALCQHVARRMFPESLSPAAKAADRVHARWQKQAACGAYALCDQVRSDSGVPCGSRYYPRGVTSILWLDE